MSGIQISVNYKEKTISRCEDLSYRILIKDFIIQNQQDNKYVDECFHAKTIHYDTLAITLHHLKERNDQLYLKIWKKHAFDMLFESKKVEVKSINKCNCDQGASSSTLDVSGKECRRAIVEFIFGSLCWVKKVEKVAL